MGDARWEYEQRLRDLLAEIQAEVNRTSAGNPPHGLDDRIGDMWGKAERAWTALHEILVREGE